MRQVERTLLQLNANYNGEPWHGAALRSIVEGIDDQRAQARPIANGHTIAELVAHATAWMDVAQRWIHGETVEMTEAIDYPDVTGRSFNDQISEMDHTYTRLIDTVARMHDSDFSAVVPGRTYRVDFMLEGVMHHNTYHAGQIAILKKA